MYASLDALQGWTGPLAFTARADDTLVRTDSQHYRAATSALAILGRNFAARHALLFPPEDDAVVSDVTPTTDWVLFLRRTRKECEGGPGVAPPGAGPVRVWVRAEPDEAAADALAERLQAGDWPPVAEWEKAEVVFAPDRTDLLTPEVTWQARYKAAAGGERVRYAAYAAETPTRAALVGVGRVDALLDTLPPVATRDAGLEPDLDIDPPAAYLAERTEGSAFLVTYADVETAEPVLAVAAPTSTAGTKELRTAIDDGDRAKVTEAVTSGFHRFDDLAASQTDLSELRDKELPLVFPEPPAGTVRAVLWLSEDLPETAQTALVTLAGKVVDAAKPVLAPTGGLAAPKRVKVAPPEGLRDAALFFVVDPVIG